MIAVFAIGPIFGLPLIGRYVRTPAILLALFYGAGGVRLAAAPEPASARARWLDRGRRVSRSRSRGLPAHGTSSCCAACTSASTATGALYADLRARRRGAGGRARRSRPAQPLSTADHRPIPYLRYWLGGDPGIGRDRRGHGQPARRAAARPAPHAHAQGASTRQNFPQGATRPAGLPRRSTANRSWRVLRAARRRPGRSDVLHASSASSPTSRNPCRRRSPRRARPTSAARPCASRSPGRRAPRCCPARG